MFTDKFNVKEHQFKSLKERVYLNDKQITCKRIELCLNLYKVVRERSPTPVQIVYRRHVLPRSPTPVQVIERPGNASAYL
jgi:hypothetical protein